MITFLLKLCLMIAVLSGLVVAAHHGLALVDAPQRDGLATLIGAAATILAGWLAWESALLQVQRDEKKRTAREAERKEDAVITVTPAIHAAAVWLGRIERELTLSGDRDGKSLRVKRSGSQLEHVFDNDALQVLMGELKADDRINLLMMTGTLHSALAIAEIHSDVVLADEDITLVRDALAKLERHLARFDADLRKVFVRDSGLKVESPT